MKKNNKKILIVIISILLVIGICIGVIFIFNPFSKSEKNISEEKLVELSDENYVVFEKGFTDIKVTDDKSALEAVGTVVDVLGISDVDKELKVTNKYTFDDNNFYQMQRYYKDIPIFGKNVILATDVNGTVISLSSNFQGSYEIVEGIDGISRDNFTVDSSKIKEKIISHIESDTQLVIDDIGFPAIEWSNIVIYDFGVESPQLSAVIDVNFSSDNYYYLYRIIYGLNDNEILFSEDVLNDAGKAAKVKAAGKDLTADGWIEDGVYRLYNDKNKISVFDFKGIDKQKVTGSLNVDFNSYGYSVISSSNNSFSTEYIYALSNLIYCSSYFSNFGDDGFDSFHVALNGHPDPDNACAGSSFENNKNYAVMLIGANNSSNDIDIIGHEYTHAVSRKIVNWHGSNQTGAINEGISDIFGVLIEANIKGQEPDWYMDFDNKKLSVYDRNIASPEKTNYPVKISDSNNSNQDYSHGYSTVISHAAYLMNTGINGDESMKIDSELLAKIWYKSMFLLHPNATFKQCADAVYNAALITKGVTFEQLVCIRAAFGEAGIDVEAITSHNVLNGTTIYAISSDNKKYQNYHVRVINCDTKKTEDEKDITDANGYKLNLESGTYIISLTDNEQNGSKNTYNKTIYLRNIPGKEVNSYINILTDFYKSHEYTAVELAGKSLDEIKSIMGGKYKSEHIQLSNAFSSSGAPYIYNYDVLPGFAFETYDNYYRGISIMDGAKLNDKISSDMTYNQIADEIGDMEGMLVAQEGNIACSKTVDGYNVAFCFIENDYIRNNKDNSGKISSDVLKGGNPSLQSIGLIMNTEPESEEQPINNGFGISDEEIKSMLTSDRWILQEVYVDGERYQGNYYGSIISQTGAYIDFNNDGSFKCCLGFVGCNGTYSVNNGSVNITITQNIVDAKTIDTEETKELGWRSEDNTILFDYSAFDSGENVTNAFRQI